MLNGLAVRPVFVMWIKSVSQFTQSQTGTRTSHLLQAGRMTSAGPVTLNRSYEFELGGQIKSEKTSKLTVTVYLMQKKNIIFLFALIITFLLIVWFHFLKIFSLCRQIFENIFMGKIRVPQSNFLSTVRFNLSKSIFFGIFLELVCRTESVWQRNHVLFYPFDGQTNDSYFAVSQCTQQILIKLN